MDAQNPMLDETVMNRRFDLLERYGMADRLEKSPRITECAVISPCLQIHHAPCDRAFLPFLQESLLDAYAVIKSWFGYPDDLAVACWMAPAVQDLQYMVCFSCPDTSFFAPGEREGWNIVVFVSPQSCPGNQDKSRMTALLAHEMTHHLICHLSLASRDSRKRRENLDLPMWLEEGLCQLMECQTHPSVRERFAERCSALSSWYDLEGLWNDLSSCPDRSGAYLQAYQVTQQLVKERGKAGVLELLALNRERGTDWAGLTRSCSAAPRR